MKAVVPQPTGLISEFVNFVTKTNAIALAIGVILGGAATKLVTSLVDNIISPIISIFTSLIGVPIEQFKLGPLLIGKVILSVIDFVAVMLVMFLIIKLVAKNMLEEKK